MAAIVGVIPEKQALDDVRMRQKGAAEEGHGVRRIGTLAHLFSILMH